MTVDLLRDISEEVCALLDPRHSGVQPQVRNAVTQAINRLARNGTSSADSLRTFGILKGTEAINAIERGDY